MNPSTVSVVASGPSALACGAGGAPGYVIAVNDAFKYVRHDAVLSMDGIWTRERVPRYFDTPTAGKALHIRRSAFKYFPKGPAAYPHANVFDCDVNSDFLSADPRVLNGGNSGQCGIALAFTMRPKRIFLYGFDMQPAALGHFHSDYEWKGEGNTNNARKFSTWADRMENVAQQCHAFGVRVFNTNPRSAIRAFEFGRPEA